MQIGVATETTCTSYSTMVRFHLKLPRFSASGPVVWEDPGPVACLGLALGLLGLQPLLHVAPAIANELAVNAEELGTFHKVRWSYPPVAHGRPVHPERFCQLVLVQQLFSCQRAIAPFKL